jgi:hypothetical protein
MTALAVRHAQFNPRNSIKGEAYSTIEVVSGLYAWDEDTHCAQIRPTKGQVTPMRRCSTATSRRAARCARIR